MEGLETGEPVNKIRKRTWFSSRREPLPLGFEDAWLNQTGHKPELLQKNRELTFR